MATQPARRRGRHHHLHALAGRQRRRQQRRRRIDALLGRIGHQLRESASTSRNRRKASVRGAIRRAVSTKASYGPVDAQLRDIGSRSSGRSARSVKCQCRCVGRRISGRRDGLELIDRSEIQIPRDQHLDAIALLLDHGRRDIDRALEYLGHHVLCRGWVDDDRPLLLRLDCTAAWMRAVDHRDQHCRAKALPEMTIDRSREARSGPVRPRRAMPAAR